MYLFRSVSHLENRGVSLLNFEISVFYIMVFCKINFYKKFFLRVMNYLFCFVTRLFGARDLVLMKSNILIVYFIILLPVLLESIKYFSCLISRTLTFYTSNAAV